MEFNGKVVIITGAGRGIGKAAALSFAQKGARVALASRTESQLSQTAAQIRAMGGTALVVPTDVGKSQDCARLLDRTVSEFGGLDVLVNNAAVDWPRLILDVSDTEFDELMAINTKSVFVLSRDAAKRMIERKTRGRIINISSINVRRAEPYYGAYAASKGAVESFTLTCAAEWGPYGITVNAVAPGSVMTEMNKDSSDPQKVAWKENRIPLGKIAAPEDIVGPIEFFASDAAAYVTGQILLVDGGSFVNANREIDWDGWKGNTD